jgi:hypothetical protein
MVANMIDFILLFKNTLRGLKTAEFDADLESIEKVAKKLT